MIRVERSSAFWGWVCEDASVRADALKGARLEHVMALVEDSRNLPMASASGGFIFRNMDGYGFVYELHTLYRREGWGREVAMAAREAFASLFAGVTSLVVTEEQAGNWRSRPPKTHGWRPASDDYQPSPAGPVRVWFLSKINWSASSVGSR